jgi:hypothetical protein
MPKHEQTRQRPRHGDSRKPPLAFKRIRYAWRPLIVLHRAQVSHICTAHRAQPACDARACRCAKVARAQSEDASGTGVAVLRAELLAPRASSAHVACGAPCSAFETMCSACETKRSACKAGRPGAQSKWPGTQSQPTRGQEEELGARSLQRRAQTCIGSAPANDAPDAEQILRHPAPETPREKRTLPLVRTYMLLD